MEKVKKTLALHVSSLRTVKNQITMLNYREKRRNIASKKGLEDKGVEKQSERRRKERSSKLFQSKLSV